MKSRRYFIWQALTLLPAVSLFARQSSVSSNQDDLQRIKQLLAGKDPLKWVFLGDSITQGAKHTFGYRSYPEIFGERVRWELKRVRDIIINTAISGNSSADLVQDFNWRAEQFSPSVVFLMIGTNDASTKKNISPDQFQENLNRLVRAIRKLGAIPVLQTPNPILTDKAPDRARLAEYVERLYVVTRAEHCLLIDHYSRWQQQMKADPIVFHQWLNDELHPNGRGHHEIAQQIFRDLDIYDPTAFTCSTTWQHL